jgi:hypothetical protein
MSKHNCARLHFEDRAYTFRDISGCPDVRSVRRMLRLLHTCPRACPNRKSAVSFRRLFTSSKGFSSKSALPHLITASPRRILEPWCAPRPVPDPPFPLPCPPTDSLLLESADSHEKVSSAFLRHFRPEAGDVRFPTLGVRARGCNAKYIRRRQCVGQGNTAVLCYNSIRNLRPSLFILSAWRLECTGLG